MGHVEGKGAERKRQRYEQKLRCVPTSVMCALDQVRSLHHVQTRKLRTSTHKQ